jgi:hypothetical protein
MSDEISKLKRSMALHEDGNEIDFSHSAETVWRLL